MDKFLDQKINLVEIHQGSNQIQLTSIMENILTKDLQTPPKELKNISIILNNIQNFTKSKKNNELLFFCNQMHESYLFNSLLINNDLHDYIDIKPASKISNKISDNEINDKDKKINEQSESEKEKYKEKTNNNEAWSTKQKVLVISGVFIIMTSPLIIFKFVSNKDISDIENINSSVLKKNKKVKKIKNNSISFLKKILFSFFKKKITPIDS